MASSVSSCSLMNQFYQLVEARQKLDVNNEDSVNVFLSIVSKLEEYEKSPFIKPTLNYLRIVNITKTFKDLKEESKKSGIREVYEFCIKQLFCKVAVVAENVISDDETVVYLDIIFKELGFLPDVSNQADFYVGCLNIQKSICYKEKKETLKYLIFKGCPFLIQDPDFPIKIHSKNFPIIEILWNNYTSDFGNFFLTNAKNLKDNKHEKIQFPEYFHKAVVFVKENIRNLYKYLPKLGCLPIKPLNDTVFSYLFSEDIINFVSIKLEIENK